MKPSERFLTYAVGFLGDALQLNQESKRNPESNAMEGIERQLVAAAMCLRTCHDVSGEDLTSAANSQGMLHFVRIARNIHVHTGHVPQALGAFKASITLDLERDEARLTTEGGTFQMEIRQAAERLRHKPKPEQVDQAIAFAAPFGGDWFKALLAACQDTSAWLKLEVPGLRALEGQKLDGPRRTIAMKDTERVRKWVEPQLLQHAAESPPGGPVRMTRPLDMIGLGQDPERRAKGKAPD